MSHFGRSTALPEGTTLIDVRTEPEFRGGHAEGSINIPLHTLQVELTRLRALEGRIILVCASGARSGQAAGWLQAQGLTNVENGGSWIGFL